MRKRNGVRSLVYVVSVCLVFTVTCTQHEDIAISRPADMISLHVQRLPEAVPECCYQLWMVKCSNGEPICSPGAEYIPIKEFVWDETTWRFRTLDGQAMADTFRLPEAWEAYDYITLTVEERASVQQARPSGVFLLAEEVQDPRFHTHLMEFPVRLFTATGYYFVGSPTDDTSYYDETRDSVIRYSPNEEKGLWLCNRTVRRQPGNVQDTVGILAKTNGEDSIIVHILDEDGEGMEKLKPDTIGVIHPPGGWLEAVVYDTIVFEYDSIFDHRRLALSYIDTIDTNNDYSLEIAYETLPAKTYWFYTYSRSLEELPDLTDYGWRYACWVFLEQPDPGETVDNTGMDLPSMSPFGRRWQKTVIGPAEWGVLPIGSFMDPSRADLWNRYLSNREVPDFPGEDFVVGASPKYDNLNLRRDIVGEWGSVVVGLEPDPSLLTIKAGCNFPLCILADFLRSGSEPGTDAGRALHNWTQYLPRIQVEILTR